MPRHSDHPRYEVLSFRVSEKEKQTIKSVVPEGFTLTDFLRFAVMLKVGRMVEAIQRLPGGQS